MVQNTRDALNLRHQYSPHGRPSIKLRIFTEKKIQKEARFKDWKRIKQNQR
jgi:hypothetical protein